MTRIRLDVAYDGTAFSGWSRQPGLRTVQGELETGLATIFRRHAPTPLLTVAGRTDAGVHASGQVAHLDLTAAQLASLERPHRGGEDPRGPLGVAAIARRLNGIQGLDADVLVRSARIAPPGFDARFSAIWRRYEYRIADRLAVQDPLRRNATLRIPAELDLEAMRIAAASLTGLHDFASYCKPREGATTIRTLQDFAWRRDAEGVLVAHLQADAFCHSMVRALVGASVAVGEGRLDPAELVVLRDARERSSAFKVVPAKGLVLTEVGYPDDAELADRAAQTRARREDPLRPV
ncbi:tRNA pseudouridine(38-40) synthase TruA [Homoserinibacter sp. YIM 151385]|uniref:tRNA pseudouridine(38-40) synthase TruA n=1 Tax=Homoserinibacter sp. YIM 151385 TaxID=2985506 RepID=UPI0022F0475D|nr:tRNA pseudouridine(38-40) synthase TruA [Homoserinibacter sp. YIM 151385]WBU39412.1 tRNA pseudouridine(38-40) synthase TruA [Homoserinibacter sp. YIM 151385]